jgi:D-arabinose 1-dehydrogenase-like Zn-dependent alcohol dehydrogenase
VGVAGIGGLGHMAVKIAHSFGGAVNVQGSWSIASKRPASTLAPEM